MRFPFAFIIMIVPLLKVVYAIAEQVSKQTNERMNGHTDASYMLNAYVLVCSLQYIKPMFIANTLTQARIYRIGSSLELPNLYDHATNTSPRAAKTLKQERKREEKKKWRMKERKSNSTLYYNILGEYNFGFLFLADPVFLFHFDECRSPFLSFERALVVLILVAGVSVYNVQFM